MSGAINEKPWLLESFEPSTFLCVSSAYVMFGAAGLRDVCKSLTKPPQDRWWLVLTLGSLGLQMLCTHLFLA